MQTRLRNVHLLKILNITEVLNSFLDISSRKGNNYSCKECDHHIP